MQAATVVINRRALRHNLQRLRELAPASRLVAVVKANAYGHGLLETARTLPDADAFGAPVSKKLSACAQAALLNQFCSSKAFLKPAICRPLPTSVCTRRCTTKSSWPRWNPPS